MSAVLTASRPLPPSTAFAADPAAFAHFTLPVEADAAVPAVEAVLEEVGQGFQDEADFLAMGIDPTRPTEAKPGSEDKVLVLAARYAAGLPLWHTDDCGDHAPDRFGGLLAGFVG